MLKKIIFSKIMIIFFSLFIMPDCCLAHWLPKSELFVGGVGPGCTLEYVASVYGQPKEKKWFNSYGDSSWYV